MTFSSGAWHEDLGQGLAQVRVNSFCRDPGVMLSEAIASPCTSLCAEVFKSFAEICPESLHDLMEVLAFILKTLDNSRINNRGVY